MTLCSWDQQEENCNLKIIVKVMFLHLWICLYTYTQVQTEYCLDECYQFHSEKCKWVWMTFGAWLGYDPRVNWFTKVTAKRQHGRTHFTCNALYTYKLGSFCQWDSSCTLLLLLLLLLTDSNSFCTIMHKKGVDDSVIQQIWYTAGRALFLSLTHTLTAL